MASITYVDVGNIVGLATDFNFPGVGVEGAIAGSYIGIAAQGTQQGNSALTMELQVDGVTASHLLTVTGGNDSLANRVNTSLWLFKYVHGLSIDIDVAWGVTMFDCTVFTFVLTGINPTVVDSDSDLSGDADPHTADLSLDIPEDGVSFASCAEHTATAEAWAEFTERAVINNFSANRYSVADYTAVTAQNPLNGTVTFTGSPGSMAAAAVSFAQADAPVVSSPEGEVTVNLTVETDIGDGTLFWVVTLSSTAPTAQQVQDGEDHNGNPATASGSQVVSASGTQTIADVTGLATNTTYFAHFVQVDIIDQASNVASSLGFEIESGGGEVTIAAGGMGMYWTPSSNALLLTGSVQPISTADGQIEGIALFVNAGTTAGFVALATASATAGELSFIPIGGGGSLYIAFGTPNLYALRSSESSTVYAQAGYALK